MIFLVTETSIHHKKPVRANINIVKVLTMDDESEADLGLLQHPRWSSL